MIRTLIQSVASVVAGLLLACALLATLEVICAFLHPVPPGVDLSDSEACKAYVADYPTWVLALAAAGWGMTTFVSTWLATRLGSGRNPALGFVVGAILIVAAAINILILPYAIWFPIVNLVVFPLAIYQGTKLASRPAPG